MLNDVESKPVGPIVVAFAIPSSTKHELLSRYSMTVEHRHDHTNTHRGV